MTLEEYRAELASLEYMRDNTTCAVRREQLNKRIFVVRAGLIDLMRSTAFAENVARFKVKKLAGPNGEVVKAVVKVGT